MMQSFFSSWRSSTLQAIAVVVLPLTFLLVAISFGSYFIHQNAMRSMVGERDERSVRAAASSIESEIHHRADIIHSLALLATDGSKETLALALADSSYLLDDFDFGLAFISQERTLLADTGNDNFWKTVPKQIDLSVISNSTTRVDRPNVATIINGVALPLLRLAAQSAHRGRGPWPSHLSRLSAMPIVCAGSSQNSVRNRS